MKTIDLKKTGYVSPEVSVEDIAVENGFAASPGTGNTQDLFDDPETIGWGD